MSNCIYLTVHFLLHRLRARYGSCYNEAHKSGLSNQRFYMCTNSIFCKDNFFSVRIIFFYYWFSLFSHFRNVCKIIIFSNLLNLELLYCFVITPPIFSSGAVYTCFYDVGLWRLWLAHPIKLPYSRRTLYPTAPPPRLISTMFFF